MTPAAPRDVERLRQANERLAELWTAYCQREGANLPAEGSREFILVRRAFLTGVALMQSAAVINLLQRIATWRPLSRRESEMLARYMRRQAPKRPKYFWKPNEDAQVWALIRKRAEEGRPAPYQRNNEVKRLAAHLGRSYMAVHRRMERLKKNGESPAIVQTEGEGARA